MQSCELNSKMYSKPPLSLERLPRCGLSLRTACLLTALLCIVYGVLELSQLIAAAVRPEGEGEAEGGLGHWAYFGFVSGTLVLSLALSGLLLVGSLTNKPALLRPWLVLKAVQLGAAVLWLLLRGASVLHAPVLANQPPTSLIALVVRFYMLTVVAAHLRELEEEVEWQRESGDGGESGQAVLIGARTHHPLYTTM